MIFNLGITDSFDQVACWGNPDSTALSELTGDFHPTFFHRSLPKADGSDGILVRQRRMSHDLWTSRAQCGGCCRCKRPLTSLRWLLVQAMCRLDHCLVDPTPCTQRYFMTRPKTFIPCSGDDFGMTSLPPSRHSRAFWILIRTSFSFLPHDAA